MTQLGTTVKVIGTPCPYCKYLLDAATVIGDDVKDKRIQPVGGDFTICKQCLNWLVFESDLSTRPIEESDIQHMAQDIFTNLVRAGQALAGLHKFKRRV